MCFDAASVEKHEAQVPTHQAMTGQAARYDVMQSHLTKSHMI